jgi:hypothetical protein
MDQNCTRKIVYHMNQFAWFLPILKGILHISVKFEVWMLPLTVNNHVILNNNGNQRKGETDKYLTIFKRVFAIYKLCNQNIIKLIIYGQFNYILNYKSKFNYKKLYSKTTPF